MDSRLNPNTVGRPAGPWNLARDQEIATRAQEWLLAPEVPLPRKLEWLRGESDVLRNVRHYLWGQQENYYCVPCIMKNTRSNVVRRTHFSTALHRRREEQYFISMFLQFS
jgi:hypothetical protein